DLAFFIPKVNVTNFDVMLQGDFAGTVTNLQGKDVQIRAAKGTWLQGDISIKGLPDIDQTLFDLNLSQLRTTSNDLERLIADFRGKKIFELPVIFDRFGDINYVGRVTGFYNDFITNGIFKTKLGDVVADINLEL